MKRRNQWLVTSTLTLPLLALPALAAAATYYVSAGSGTDAGNCSTPCKTITYAAANVPAGTSGAPNVIMVAAGTYDETGNSETFPINFSNDFVSLVGAGLATTTIDVDATDTWDALDVDAKGFSVSGFTFENTYPTGTGDFDAIDISEGGFQIFNNKFGDTTVVDYGVNFHRKDTDRSTSVSFGDMAVTGNTFNTSVYGVFIDVQIDFDYTTENLTAAFGNFMFSGNTFSVTDGDGIDADYLFFVTELFNGTVTAGDFTVDNNTFTNGNEGLDFYSGVYDVEDTQTTIGKTIVTNNTFTDQSETGIFLDYWDAEYLYGTSSVVIGDLTVSGNTVTGNVATYTDCDGISINDFTYFQYIYDESTVTTGTVNVTNNTVNIGDNAFYIYYNFVEYLGEEYWDDTVTVTVGPVNITGNKFTSDAEFGAFLEYYDLAYYTYGTSRVIVGPLAFSNNTVVSEWEAFYFYVDYWGDYMYEDSSLLINPITISNNKLTSNNDDAAYIEFYDIAYYMFDNASVVIKEMDIRDNTLTGKSGDGIYFELEDYAYEMVGNSSLTASPITVHNNTITSSNSDGIYIYYYEEHVGNYLYDNATAILPDWVITNNTIDVIAGDSGLDFYTNYNPYDIYDQASIQHGSMFIDGNTFNPNKDTGMPYGIYLNFDGVAYDFYGPVNNTWGDITITNNKMYTNSSEAIYVYYYHAGYTFDGISTLNMAAVEIADNTIDTTPLAIETYYYLYSESGAKVSVGELNIHDNMLTGITKGGIYAEYYNENDTPDTATLTIGAPIMTDNTIEGNAATADGIYLSVVNSTEGITFAMPTITGNTISGFNNGIYLEDVEEAKISCNTVTSNTGSGLYFDTDETFSPIYNSLVGNGLGLEVDAGATATVTAEKNWWGDAAGPAACAACNKIVAGGGSVDFNPWLHSGSISECNPFSWPMFVPATTGAGRR